MSTRRFAAIILAMALGACAELTAEAPLFAPNPTTPPVLTEGIWIGIGEECPERNLRRQRFAKECAPLEIRRQPDGAWIVRLRDDLMTNLTAQERADAVNDHSLGPYRIVLAPAVERDVGDGYAPLYAAEFTRSDPDYPSVAYMAIVPVGEMPASEIRLTVSLGCLSILRDGPIEGVEVHYETLAGADGETYQNLTGCTASSPAAIREAVRRTVIENFADFTKQRFVFVRAN